MPQSTSARLTPIIPFNLIIDTDYGIIQLIKDKYYDKDVFSGIIEAKPEQIIYFLYSRDSINPINRFLLDKKFDSDDMYNNLIEKEYSNILKRSISTNFFEVVKLFNKSDGAINPIILCKNELEESYMQRLSRISDTQFKTILGDYSTIDLTAYDTIYLKHYTDALKCIDKLYGKNIYIANYNFNFEVVDEQRILLSYIYILLLDSNIAKIIDIYRIDEDDIPVG